MDDRFHTSLTRRRNMRGWASTLRRRFVRSKFAYDVVSSMATAYLRLVRATSRLIIEGDSLESQYARSEPLIATAWHGESFLLPVLRPPARSVDIMVSRAQDGDVFGRSLRKLGFGVVRGSGASDRSRMYEKGSVAAFRGLLASLNQGRNVFLTADFDAATRGTVSPGVIALARLSQRPIIPVVAVTSRRTRLGSWDRTALALPFGRIVFVSADPILVPRRATDSELEEKRREVERALAAITNRAYAIADRRRG